MPPYYMRFLHSNSTLHWPSIVRRLIRLPSIVIRHRFKWKLSICLNMQRIHDLLCRTVGSTARASVYSNSEFQKESTKRSREEFAVCNAPEHPEAWGCRISLEKDRPKLRPSISMVTKTANLLPIPKCLLSQRNGSELQSNMLKIINSKDALETRRHSIAHH